MDFCSTYLHNQRLYGATEIILGPVLHFSFRIPLKSDYILLFLLGHYLLSHPPVRTLIINAANKTWIFPNTYSTPDELELHFSSLIK